MEYKMEEVAARALEKMGSDRYQLSVMVAKRAEQLALGSQALVDLDKSKFKFEDIALLEIAESKITLEGLFESS